ncbi:hypothetical protein Ndes2526B_g08126 [Nannochloris sp. 'desiccata']|nr:hypothetical protein KSW81_002759 [Chlorella desiccata (nom. nud.)]KAH7617519.1 putative Large-conductance mechanosensitive channel [Chlorella desiccata (nom. nud.)]
MASKVKAVGGSAIGCCGNFVSGFRDFVLRGNVVDLAVAVVVGGAFKELINAFVAAFITPLFGMIGSSDATANLTFTANGSVFPYGLFINAVISFIIICFIVYVAIVLPLMGLMSRLFPIRTCPECMQEDIPVTATRCKYCCSVMEPIMKKSKSGSTMEPVTTAPPPAVI